MPPEADERFLRGVFGIVMVVEHRVSDGVDKA
jgi:hypothetical protein